MTYRPSSRFLVLPVLLSMCFAFHLPLELHAQNNEREVSGTVTDRDFRAPFGDDFEVFNLGSSINSKFSEYNPILTADQQFILFTTRSDSTTGGKVYPEDRQSFEDMHITALPGSKSNIPSEILPALEAFVEQMNSSKHDAPVYITDDNKTILLFKENDLWYSELKDGVFAEPERFSKNINFKYYHRHASLTHDGNTMVFTSEVLDKKLNRFHLDLFKSVRAEDGSWSKPERLPRYINSPFNEDSPEISPDGKLLFFSSDRTDGFGGYDVYYVELESPDSTVFRLREPLNSPADDIYFKMLADSSKAYISSNRLGGFGNMDIYEVIFHRFDLSEPCDINKSINVSLSGLDAFELGTNVVLRAQVAQSDVSDVRAMNWYLDGELVGARQSIELAIEDTGTYEVRLYASSLRKDSRSFISTCLSKTIKVVEQGVLSKNAPGNQYLDKLNDASTLNDLMITLPVAGASFGLENRTAITFQNEPVLIKVVDDTYEKQAVELSAASVSAAAHGNALIQDKQTVVYYPKQDFVGFDAFEVNVRNPYDVKESLWVAVEVKEKAYAPKASRLVDDVHKASTSQTIAIKFLENDQVDMSNVARIKLSSPKNGMIDSAFAEDGVVKYTSDRGYKGIDAFDYEVRFEGGDAERANIYIEVGEIEITSRTAMDYATTTHATMASINVFVNDELDPKEKPVLNAIGGITHGAGQVYDRDEGIIVYVPRPGFHGIEEFTYTVKLKDGTSLTEIVRVMVEEMPDETVLAAVTAGEVVDEPISTSKKYDITKVDESMVDVSNKPKLELQPIYFDFDRATIRQDAKATMAMNVKELKANPNAVIQIVSYCDSRGPQAYNMILSARRAKSSLEYLVAQGIDKNRIVATIGVGEDNLVNDCGDGVPCTIEQHQLNRRSEFVVVGSLK